MPNKSFLLTEKLVQQIEEAVVVLKAGGIVAFPTETVYGLGADAMNSKAIQRVYEAKQRPMHHPVIVHLSDFSQVAEWAKTVNAFAQALIKHFWPGPLTLILPRTSRVLDAVTGGQDTVALRMPANSIALALLEKMGSPLIAPSANPFGRLSPTHSDHVKQALGHVVDWVIEGGRCSVGIESTIVDTSSREPRILRLGAITPDQIAQVTGIKLLSLAQHTAIRVPGALAQHYAPQTRLSIVSPQDLLNSIQRCVDQRQTVSVLSQQNTISDLGETVSWLQMPKDPKAYMQEFYHALSMADQQKRDIILIESLPEEDAWLAIRDRMKKAVH